MSQGQVTALTDTRDNNVYTVTKLADGNCWMMENLRLDPAEATITKENTNNPTDAFLDEAKITRPKTTDWCTSYNKASNCTNEITYGTHNIDRSFSASPDRNGQNTNISPYSSWYSYGTTYNGYTATAGNARSYASYTTSTGYEVEGDICPSGWRLPSGNNANFSGYFSTYQSDIKTLADSMTNSATQLRKYPANFVLSGTFQSKNEYNRNSYGTYWTATNVYERRNEYVYLNTYSISKSNSNITYSGTYSYHGFSVRCMSDDEMYKIHFDPNTSDTVTGIMADQFVTTDSTINLRANEYVRVSDGTKYVFDGWNTLPHPTESEPGTSYTNSASVSNLASQGSSITLYAQWKADEGPFLTVNMHSDESNFENGTNLNTIQYNSS